MNYGNIKNCDIADGLGVRVSLFVSGCTHHCKGCFNQDTWDFSYGHLYTEEVEEKILKMLEPSYINGLTLLGGEPFELVNQHGLLSLVKKAKERFPNKTIWAYSGYLFDKDLIVPSRAHDDKTMEFLSYIDVLVDGPFIERLKDISLRFRGSSNQRIIDVKKSLEKNEVVLFEFK